MERRTVEASLFEKLKNGRTGFPQNVRGFQELVYSFIFAILSVICVWLSFGFANRHLGGTSAGYIAAGVSDQKADNNIGREPIQDASKSTMSFVNLRDQIEHSDNVFLKMPHIFKPLQVLNAIILAICVGSTAGSENGVLWFVIITSMLISIAATVLLALGLQDSIMDSISNGSVPWNVVELVYSFIFAILSVICVWLSFGFANRHLGGTSAGYIAAGLFSIVHASLYSVPCAIIYDSVHSNGLEQSPVSNIQPAHPFRDAPYQDL
ncbi:hypothetical protein OSTOST_02257 [Ostertagia ostertagi]